MCCPKERLEEKQNIKSLIIALCIVQWTKQLKTHWPTSFTGLHILFFINVTLDCLSISKICNLNCSMLLLIVLPTTLGRFLIPFIHKVGDASFGEDNIRRGQKRKIPGRRTPAAYSLHCKEMSFSKQVWTLVLRVWYPACLTLGIT